MPTASQRISARDSTACSSARAAHHTNALVALAGIVTLSLGALRVMDGAMSLGALIAAMMIVWRVLARSRSFRSILPASGRRSPP